MSEVKGTIIVLEQTIEVGSNGFRKRLVVVKTDEQYSQEIPIDFVQDKTSLLDNYKIGSNVKVSINIRGNEYNGKYYVNLQGWRIELEGEQQAQQAQQEQIEPPVDDDQDLPF